MRRHILAIILAVFVAFNCTMPVLACNEQQSDVYIMQLLFGDESSRYENDPDVAIILDGLYICSIQSDMNGKDKLNALKRSRVRGIPTLQKIDVSSNELYSCSHDNWNHVAEKCQKEQQKRKDIFRSAIVRVFDFGFIDESFQKDEGQIDSFAALLYYCHILADYLADDPLDTRISAKGYDIPAYAGNPYFTINNDIPSFSDEEKRTIESFKEYSDLDKYGRCGAGITSIGPDVLATVNPRGNIGYINPTGWDQKTYNTIMPDGQYLYNRCHLIAHSLGGIDTRWNLVTGTRYLNEAMEKPESDIARYVQSTGNHVLYKVNPVYVGSNQVASGVQLEGYSLEDQGKGLHFNRYYYNVQPGVDIDYSNGSSVIADCTVDNDYFIPFAINGADDSNPDLMWEIKDQLQILFAGQANNSEYTLMMHELENIETQARNVKGVKDWEVYKNLKPLQHSYMETLTEYVPRLLQNEKFFKEVFQ